jgi:hypothetical protein
VISAKTAHLIGDQYGLKDWSIALFPAPSAKIFAVDETLKRDLLNILLGVYINDGYEPVLSTFFVDVMVLVGKGALLVLHI